MSFPAELYESFRRVSGVPVTILGVALAVAAFYFMPQAVLPWKHVVAGIVVVFVVVAVLLDLCVRLHKAAQSPLPRILRALPAGVGRQDCVALLLLEPSELFGQQAFVSIFHLKDGFEVLVALGEAIHVQRDKKVQILVLQTLGSADEHLWRTVLGNDPNVLRHILVKPSLPANLPIPKAPNGRITEQEN